MDPKQTLVRDFLNCTLPKEEFTHRAHIIAGAWHVRNLNFHDAMCSMRAAIILFNSAVGGTNNGNSGYHETLTYFWLKVIHEAWQENTSANEDEIFRVMLKNGWVDRELPVKYFGIDVSRSEEARSVNIMHPCPEFSKWLRSKKNKKAG